MEILITVGLVNGQDAYTNTSCTTNELQHSTGEGLTKFTEVFKVDYDEGLAETGGHAAKYALGNLLLIGQHT